MVLKQKKSSVHDKLTIAIDPGRNGAVVMEYKGKITSYNMPETAKDIDTLLRSLFELGRNQTHKVVYMEEPYGYIGPKPGKGVFAFGRHVGNIEMSVLCRNVRLVLVKPQTWMTRLKVGSRDKKSMKDWKNKLKARAQALYPSVEVTLKNSDALLILEYSKKEGFNNGS
jgi:hypothetical protein